MPIIPFENATLITNVDLEDITVAGFRELTNYYQENGILRKTFSFGSYIPDTFSSLLGDQEGLYTYIEPNLTTSDRLYILVDISTNSPLLKAYDDDGDTWLTINTGSDQTFNSMTFLMPVATSLHHKLDRNPIFQLSNILRVYPGNVADANAQGIWLAYIDRNYYDNLFSPTAKFYGYPLNIQPPSLDLTVMQLQGGSFTPDANNVDTKFYKFSNVYDGVQESLLSDQTGVVYNESINMFGKFEFSFDVNSTTSFDAALQSNRITAINMYRADDADADYKLIQVIDYLRPGSGDDNQTRSGTSSGNTGQFRAYIPELETVDFDSFTSPFTLTLTDKTGADTVNAITSSHSGTGNTVFDYATQGISTDAGWNTNWRMVDSLSAELGSSNLGGAYSGMNAFILDDSEDELGTGNYSGGVIERTVTPAVDNIGVTSNAGNVRCTIKNSAVASNIAEDDIVILSGFTSNPTYNGRFLVSAANPSEDLALSFDIASLAHTGDEDGKFVKMSDTRTVDENIGRAIHSAEGWTVNRDTTGGDDWRLLSPVSGLFYPTKSSDTVTYTFYDTDLLGTSSAPLQGESTIDVNGRFAIEVLGRVFQYNVVIDPTSDDPETQQDFLMYSELDQPDVMPASNQFRIADREGGEGTGLARLFGNVVCMKQQAIVTLHLNNDPANPTNWYLRESAFNIGNVAPQGYITVNDATLYVTALDGIYRFTINDLAEANQSSVAQNRISDRINDIFKAMTSTERSEVEATFEPLEQEVYFKLASRMFAYSIFNNTWREIVSANIPSDPAEVIFATDENANVLAFNNEDKTLYNTSVAESTLPVLQSKTFVTNDIRPEVVRYLHITYKSSTDLTAEIYTEKDGLASSDSSLLTKTIPSSSGSIVTKRFRIAARAEKYNVRILSTTTDTNEIEIHKLKLVNEAR